MAERRLVFPEATFPTIATREPLGTLRFISRRTGCSEFQEKVPFSIITGSTKKEVAVITLIDQTKKCKIFHHHFDI